jgi:TPR repeat protein
VSGALDIRHLSVEIAGSPVLTDVILSIARGAKIDDAPAMFYLGLAYQLGSYGVPQDFNKAGEWYYKAAVKGHTKAMVYLALLYDQDNPKAREWYEMVEKELAVSR